MIVLHCTEPGRSQDHSRSSSWFSSRSWEHIEQFLRAIMRGLLYPQEASYLFLVIFSYILFVLKHITHSGRNGWGEPQMPPQGAHARYSHALTSTPIVRCPYCPFCLFCFLYLFPFRLATAHCCLMVLLIAVIIDSCYFQCFFESGLFFFPFSFPFW